MNHSRRGFFAALASVAAATGVQAEAQVIEREPPPLALVLKNHLSPEAKANFRKRWEKMHVGLRDMPLIILDGGMELVAIPGAGRARENRK
jgi:hypothetical protein